MAFEEKKLSHCADQFKLHVKDDLESLVTTKQDYSGRHSARSPLRETYSFQQLHAVDASSDPSIFKDQEKRTLTPISNDRNMMCHE